MGATTTIVTPKTCLVPFRNESSCEFFISDSPLIWGVSSTERARHRQRLRESTINANAPETKVRLLRRAGPHRSKDHTTAIWSPSANAIDAWMISQPFGIAARRGHNEYVGISRDRSSEGNLQTIRREVRIDFSAWSRRQPSRLSTAP